MSLYIGEKEFPQAVTKKQKAKKQALNQTECNN